MQPCNHSDQFQWRHQHPEAGMKQQTPLCALTLCKKYPDVERSPRKSRLLQTGYCFTKSMSLTSSHLWDYKDTAHFSRTTLHDMCTHKELLSSLGQSHALTYIPACNLNRNPSTDLRKTLSCAYGLYLHADEKHALKNILKKKLIFTAPI